MVGTVTFSAKRSLYLKWMQWVRSTKRSIHTVDLACVVGTITFSAKRSFYLHAVDAVGTQYAVGVSAKRSTHTVDLANMGVGDHYL